MRGHKIWTEFSINKEADRINYLEYGARSQRLKIN